MRDVSQDCSAMAQRIREYLGREMHVPEFETLRMRRRYRFSDQSPTIPVEKVAAGKQSQVWGNEMSTLRRFSAERLFGRTA